MRYEDFKINFKENKKQLIEAFIFVLGEEYRNIVEKNINNTLLIDYITNYQYRYFLRKNYIDESTNISLIKDEENKFKVYSDINNEFINTICELLPNNKIVNNELKIYKENNDYETPLFNSYLNDSYYSVSMKFEVIEKLGYHVEIKEPFNEFYAENEQLINDYWNKLFTEKETSIIVDTALKMEEKLRKEYIFNSGNMGQKREDYEREKLLSKNYFDLIINNESCMQRCVVPNYSLINNDVIPVIFFPTLGNIDKDYLTGFIHELTHAVSANLVSNNNKKIILKLGTMIYNDIENSEDNNDAYMLNEAMTQYIAVLVTDVIIEHNLCPNLFSFEIPEQRNVFESSYKNVVMFFKNFFQENFEEVKECYLGKHNKESIGKIPFDKLVELANLVSRNKKMIEQIDLGNYKKL